MNRQATVLASAGGDPINSVAREAPAGRGPRRRATWRGAHEYPYAQLGPRPLGEDVTGAYYRPAMG